MSITRGAVAITLLAALTSSLRGQVPPQTSTLPATRPGDDELVTFTFPANVDLRVLINYVGDRLDVQFLYEEEQIGQQRVTIKPGARIPKGALLEFLQVVLQSKGFALVDMDQPGWKRIVSGAILTNVARPATAPAGQHEPGVVTQVFVLQVADAARMEQALKPFLTQPGGAVTSVPEQRLLVVTDYAFNMSRIDELVRQLDQSTRAVVVEFITLEHGEAQEVSAKVAQVMQGTINATGVSNPVQVGLVEVGFDQRTNQVALIGPRERVTEAARVVRQFDAPAGLLTRTYQFQFASPERVDKLMQQMLDPAVAKRAYQAGVDKDARLLVVNATPELHERVEEMKAALDVASVANPIGFYKLSNTTAGDVLETLLSIQGEDGTNWRDRDRDRGSAKGRANPLAGRRSRGEFGATRGYGGATGGYGGAMGSRADGGRRLGGEMGTESASGLPTTQFGGQADASGGSGGFGAPDAAGARGGSFATQDATVTADRNTNTIIVVADPAVQQVYEQLIRMLDKRRPQVLIECTIVTLDTSRDFRVGVDLGVDGRIGDSDLVTFSSFGVSRPAVDAGGAATGRLALVPGLRGFNGALVSSDVADIVVNALLNTGRARVVSAPRILVNDNATGALLSTAEQPYTDINIGDTVSTTSFGGYVEAGTSIELTPHISDADYLQLEYLVALNRFSGEGTNGIPPPRQTSALTSTVTIPDGSTIIIGGLNSSNNDRTLNAIPILGQIPVLEYLFSSRSVSSEQTTLFVFIRPVILRDDRFQDLKYLSEKDIREAGLAQDLPLSEPLTIR